MFAWSFVASSSAMRGDVCAYGAKAILIDLLVRAYGATHKQLRGIAWSIRADLAKSGSSAVVLHPRRAKLFLWLRRSVPQALLEVA